MNTPINYARSLGALFIGFFVLAGIDTICTALTLKYFFAPQAAPQTPNQTIGLLVIKVVSGLTAGYVAAALAGTRRWQHALLLAGVILSIGALGVLLIPAAPRTTYTILALLLSPLCIIIGGLLRHLRAA